MWARERNQNILLLHLEGRFAFRRDYIITYLFVIWSTLRNNVVEFTKLSKGENLENFVA